MNALALYPISKTKEEFNTVSKDPIYVKKHILSNGLQILMSVNKAEPRIFSNIAVRAGSKQDPSDTTGLAHYLEHMMFKGTSQIGSLDWEQESALLSQIAEVYEKHRHEIDPSVRSEYYAQIDGLSNEAAKFVATNEYDKLVSSLGAKATNAYTSSEQTVYVNDIPSNELEKWFKLESERFKMVILRLFHTELETVYEEFNMVQDNDNRKVYQAMMESLFPTHPYGTQTTIGKGEHIKSPSHYNIINFFQTYYVPNNMAIVLAGDFEPEAVIALAEKYFGDYTFREVPPFTYEQQVPLNTIIRKEIWGHQAEYIQIAWRLGDIISGDSEIASMIASMLHNNQAGLIDIDLVKKQKVLEAAVGSMSLIDYSAFVMTGKPRQGQSLEDVEKLLLEQIDRIKKGDFPEWLMQAVIKDFKYNQLKNYENNQSRVGSMTDSFVKNIDWNKYITRIERMQTISKDEIIAFANAHFNDNCVIIYKKTGIDASVKKVEKPAITPVSLNRTENSDFAHNFLNEESPRLKPKFIDFNKAIQTVLLDNGLELDYIKNTTNETFSLYYILEIGRNIDKMLPLAIGYLPFLGTNQYSAEELEQEFYKLGLSFDVFCNDERSYVVLNGLEESFTEGVRLFEHILNNVLGNEKVLKNMIADIISKRDNEKKDKRAILRNAMMSYAKFGAHSPFTDILSKETLLNIQAQTLVDKIRNLSSLPHRIFYYGNKKINSVVKILDKEHTIEAHKKADYTLKEYPELETAENKVLFVHFPMVQTEILMLSKGTAHYSLDENIMSSLYNNYFGSGLSSIVFQEIREARALAYAANAFYSSPSKANRAHYLQAYLGTQSDKLQEAITALTDIINDMPISENQIEHARISVLKTIESERITKANIYWTYRNSLDRGINFDMRKNVYQTISTTSSSELKEFQEKHIKNRFFTYLILGDKSKIDFSYLNSIGNVQELSLEEIFGH
jgi:predicted Zn-dependent peptidase